MMTYSFKVDGDRISLPEIHGAVSGSVNYYRCAFAFSAQWQALSKFAVFMDGDSTYTVMTENDSCLIPDALIAEPKKISVGIYGSSLDEENPLRISTDFVNIDIREGAYRQGTAPEVPQADLWEIYFQKASEQATKTAVDAAIAAADTAKAEIDMMNSAAVAELEKHTLLSDNPHKVTAAQIGLGNVDNTADADKPVSNPTKEYVDGLMGDAGALLDSVIAEQEAIISMQNALIGGESA